MEKMKMKIKNQILLMINLKRILKKEKVEAIQVIVNQIVQAKIKVKKKVNLLIQRIKIKIMTKKMKAKMRTKNLQKI